ncbi:hypothetical protein BWQ96_07146 [Gracilariopsis chorda]|uniref:CDT1 Geminin-binding domain-containing protein n=1 Tax=Gracilariopsis chorda TaxID=448386 RepID=A0A2V3ILZ6_9FLOR|nr:hypothetical protein BWQ96_07146 [Gracilariopsis chorda]|eukprot:PXF43112.1 hypothetical protein BWQ96_07146 [Gracilariopsis chorda]
MASKRGMKRLRKETERAIERGEQHQLTDLIGDRVRKPRTFSDISARDTKRQKLSEDIPEALPAPVAPPSAITSAHEIDSQKKRWRLSEILKKERHTRRMKKFAQPSFVLATPHMDSRRPSMSTKTEAMSSTVGENKKSETKINGKKAKAKSPSPSTVLSAEPVQSKSFSSSVPGGDALLYDRCMLPKSYALVLDTLIALETAVALVRVRKMRPTVGALRDIVARSTRRDFTVKVLSQLAHLVPEAVAVLPGPKATFNPKRPSDNLIVRLDKVDEDRGADGDKGRVTSSLGVAPARLRRSLLHKRLLQQVRKHHEKFLEQISATRYKSDIWHPDFDLEKEVSELPAPPLYTSEKSRERVRQVKRVRFNLPDSTTLDASHEQDDTSPEEDEGDEAEGCIPRSLLERVRARSEALKKQESKLKEEKKRNEGLFSKLPDTMDSIFVVMRNEKRFAMGWQQLILKLEKLHPKKWTRTDLEKQLDAIALLATEWCKKVELTSSRGGYAFRVVSEAAFGQAREKLVSTKSHDLLSE